MRNMLLDIELWPQPISTIPIHYNSKATMSWAYNKIYNRKSRHMSLWHEYVRELISNGIMIIVFVRSYKNLADLLVKGLPRDAIKSISSGMGLKLFNHKTPIMGIQFWLNKIYTQSLMDNSKLLLCFKKAVKLYKLLKLH